MELSKVIKELKLTEKYASVLAVGWVQSMQAVPGADFGFLDETQIVECREYCQMDPELDNLLISVADKIKENPAMKVLAWHGYYQLIYTDLHVDFLNWPLLKDDLGDDFGLFYLLIALGVVPEALGSYRKKGIPEEIIQNSLLEIKGFCNNHINAHQVPGLLARQLNWLRNYKCGKIFRLGRLEFKLEPFANCYHVYRHKKTHNKLMFAPENVMFNAKGLVDGVGGVVDKDGAWKSTYERTQKQVVGNPIDPKGIAIKQKMTLDLDEWEEYIPQGAWVLDMHIPPGGGMGVDICLNSFKQAAEFFPKYFPEFPVKAVNCGSSWIFDIMLEEKLPESNLAKFIRELYIYPIHSSGQDAIFFVFGNDLKEIANPPRKTSLQRALLDTLDNGEPLRSSGAMFFLEDLDKWGTHTYRQMWQEQ